MRKYRWSVFLLIAALAPSGWSEVSGATLARLAERFNTDDSLSRLVAFEEFEKSVATPERAGTLVALWSHQKNSGPPLVQLSVLAYLTGNRDVAWTPALRDRVVEAGRHPQTEMRRMSLRVVAKREPAGLPTFLEDANDALREDAVIEIGRRPEGRRVLEDYARKYGRDKARTRSVKKATFFLEKGVGGTPR